MDDDAYEYTAVIQITVTQETCDKIEERDSGRIPDTDYVHTELGWASGSFDDFNCSVYKASYIR